MRRRFKNAVVGYEKLQLFRIYNEVHCALSDSVDNVLRKFVNESFHVENEYIMQLNPHIFDNVPEHITTECERLMSGIGA